MLVSMIVSWLTHLYFYYAGLIVFSITTIIFYFIAAVSTYFEKGYTTKYGTERPPHCCMIIALLFSIVSIGTTIQRTFFPDYRDIDASHLIFAAIIVLVFFIIVLILGIIALVIYRSERYTF